MKVKLPDGKIAQFPDDMKLEEIEAIIGKQYKDYKPEDYPSIQPKPTADVAKGLASYGLPIAGDILGMYLAPQLKAPQTVGRVINLAFRAMGSGVGGFGGSVAGQKIDTGEVDFKESAKEGFIGAGGEVALGPFGSLGKKLAKPLARVASNITFLGQGGKKMFAAKLMEKTVKKANDFLYEVAPQSIKQQTVDIEDIVLKMKNAKSDISNVYEKYKDPLRKQDDREGMVLAGDTFQHLHDDLRRFAQQEDVSKIKTATINKFIRSYGYSPYGQYADTMRMVLRDEDLTAKDFMFLIDNVFKEKPMGKSQFTKLNPKTQERRESFKQAMLSDVVKADPTNSKMTADKMTAEYYDFLTIKKIYDKGLKDAGEGMQRIDPYKLSTHIYMNKDTILKLDEKRAKMGLDPIWPKMEEEAKYYGNLVPYFQEAKTAIGGRGGSMGTAASLAMAASGGTGATFLFGVPGAFVIEGFGAVSAYSLLSPTGKKAVKIAAKHVLKPTVKSGLHLGGQLVDLE